MSSGESVPARPDGRCDRERERNFRGVGDGERKRETYKDAKREGRRERAIEGDGERSREEIKTVRKRERISKDPARAVYIYMDRGERGER